MVEAIIFTVLFNSHYTIRDFKASKSNSVKGRWPISHKPANLTINGTLWIIIGSCILICSLIYDSANLLRMNSIITLVANKKKTISLIILNCGSFDAFDADVLSCTMTVNVYVSLKRSDFQSRTCDYMIYRVFHAFWGLKNRHSFSPRKAISILKKGLNRSWSAVFLCHQFFVFAFFSLGATGV